MDSKIDEHLQEFSIPLLTKLKQPCIQSKKKKKNAYNNNNNENNVNNKKEKSGLLSNSSTYSILPISEVTQGAVEVWANLPDEIRQDPSLASFRQEHERIHGKFTILIQFLNQIVWLIFVVKVIYIFSSQIYICSTQIEQSNKN